MSKSVHCKSVQECETERKKIKVLQMPSAGRLKEPRNAICSKTRQFSQRSTGGEEVITGRMIKARKKATTHA